MTYTLSFHPRPTYLHAIVTGRNNKENVSRYTSEVIRECLARNCLRVLIEERLDGPRLGTLDVFDLIDEGSERFFGAVKAIAYVDVNHQGDLMEFAEIVASNRGLPMVVFSSVAEAERWLQTGERERGEPVAKPVAGKQLC